MAEEATEVQKPKAAKGKTLQLDYDNFDPVGEGQWYRNGDVLDVVPPYIQGLLDLGLAKLV